MTVVLTGDVHQWIDSSDRAYANETESELALTYARIAAHHGLKVTLFFTGLGIMEHPASVTALLEEPNIEVGGHGWDSFDRTWRYRAYNKLLGSPHGSSSMQSRMVRRTCANIEGVTGHRIRSWRNHAYCHDVHTPSALVGAGIQVWSDDVDRDRVGPYLHTSGLTILPINTTPDHEHLYHGDQTLETVPGPIQPRYNDARAWLDRVLGQTEAIVARRGVATILAHPLCMKVVDDWQTFERLCASLSRFRSACAADPAPNGADAQQASGRG